MSSLNSIKNLWNSKYGLLILLWVFLSLFNIDKAFHIDDAFHLEAAQHIQENPIHPMSGFVNWKDSPQPLSSFNQPPLFFYLIAITGKMFTYSEIAMHLLMSLFTFLALYFFNSIANLISPSTKRELLLYFAFWPPFLINQNAMVDVPLLAMILAATFYLLQAQQKDSTKNYLVSVLFFSVGLMIKYTILPFILVVVLIILVKKQFNKLIVLVLPAIVFTIWCSWNYIEYGLFHFFDRSSHQIDFDLLPAFFACLGATAPFIIALIYGLKPSKRLRFAIYSGLIISLVLLFMAFFKWLSWEFLNRLLSPLFLAIGLMVVLIILLDVVKTYISKFRQLISSHAFILLLLLSAFSVFVIISPQFMASRHLLVVVPFALLLSHKLISKAGFGMNSLGISIAFVMTVSLGMSDWQYADYYRNAVELVKKEENQKTWALGHWAWQWYAQKAGMKVFNSDNELAVQLNDQVVFPANIPKQKISENIRLDTMEIIIQEPSLGTFISGKNYASFYNSSFSKPMWKFSTEPIDTLYICRVIDDISVQDLVKTIQSNEKWLNDVKLKAIDKNIELDSMIMLDAHWLKAQAIKD